MCAPSHPHQKVKMLSMHCLVAPGARARPPDGARCHSSFCWARRGGSHVVVRRLGPLGSLRPRPSGEGIHGEGQAVQGPVVGLDALRGEEACAGAAGRLRGAGRGQERAAAVPAVPVLEDHPWVRTSGPGKRVQVHLRCDRRGKHDGDASADHREERERDDPVGHHVSRVQDAGSRAESDRDHRDHLAALPAVPERPDEAVAERGGARQGAEAGGPAAVNGPSILASAFASCASSLQVAQRAPRAVRPDPRARVDVGDPERVGFAVVRPSVCVVDNGNIVGACPEEWRDILGGVEAVPGQGRQAEGGVQDARTARVRESDGGRRGGRGEHTDACCGAGRAEEEVEKETQSESPQGRSRETICKAVEQTEEEVGDGREPCAGPGESEDEGVEQIEWRAEEQGGRALDEKAGRCVTGTVDLVLDFVCVDEEDETKEEGQEGQEEEGGSVQQRLRPHGVDGDHEQRDRRAMNAADVPTAISRGYM